MITLTRKYSSCFELEALTQVLTEQLSDGKIVRFGDFDSFQVGVGSWGAETKEIYDVFDQITQGHFPSGRRFEGNAEQPEVRKTVRGIRKKNVPVSLRKKIGMFSKNDKDLSRKR
ncbi:MAG: hypothetical protein LBL07_19200 [Tannerella sp.]|jgi:hypothetical protein|nr:hypothetical protein [Tannerella sp.]